MADGYRSTAPSFAVEGRAEADLARDLLTLEVEHGCGGLRSLVATFAAAAPRSDGRRNRDVVELLDGDPLDFGRVIEVTLGSDDRRRKAFTGRISALEAGFEEGDLPHVAIAAEDALMTLRLTQRSRTYRNVTDGDIVAVIAREHGLRSNVAVDGPTHELVVQANQSDLAFLRMRLERLGAELWADDRTLHAATRPERRGVDLRLVQGGDLIALTARADLAHQASAVAVSGFDARRKAAIDVEAPAADVAADSGRRGRNGSAVLTATLGTHVGRRTRDVPLHPAEAKALAKAELLRRARSFVTVCGTTAGTPELDVGSRLTLDRCGRPFDGDGYYVTSVRHRFDRRHGYRTHFEAERSSINPLR